MDEFISAVQMVNKMENKEITHSVAATSSVSGFSPNSIVVGLKKDVAELTDRLTGDQPQLDAISIIGMGGLGKTTLARKLYDDPLVRLNFDICAWVTLSQDYNFRTILLGILAYVVGNVSSEMLEKKNDVLELELYRSLLGRRFFIVLDDVWSSRVWDDINRCLPKENNRSRIILTTRESEVANYVDHDTKPHQIDLLNDVESWELLQSKVFGNDFCHLAFKEIGEKIVKNCRGLPLAITLVGGLLSTSKDNLDFWNEVSDNTTSVLNDKDHFSSILLVSYNHLPSHLKPCFLYFGCFPEDTDIRASMLIQLWVAEGFLKPIENTCPEDAAELYLKSLVRRNLISVGRYESNEKIISYGIHDLLRDLCVRQAMKENFLCVKNREVRDKPISLRRVSVHTSYRMRDVLQSREHMSLARSFTFIGQAPREIISPVFLGLRFLKILNVLGIDFYQFPEELWQSVNLHFLAFSCSKGDMAALERFHNLQTCILQRKNIGYGFFNLRSIGQLRHLKFKKSRVFFESDIVLENLQTLCGVLISDQVLEKLPNLRKLKANWQATNFIALPKLETLKCSDYSSSSTYQLSSFTFPPSLKKLVLCDCTIAGGSWKPWDVYPTFKCSNFENVASSALNGK